MTKQNHTLFIFHYSLFISFLVLYILRTLSVVRTQHFEDVAFLDSSVLELFQKSFLSHLFPESRFSFIISSWQLPDKFSEFLVIDFPDVDILSVA